MKKLLVIFGLSLFILNKIICQNTYSRKVEAGSIYLKGQSKPLTESELFDLFSKGSSIYTEEKINKYGEVDSIIVDPNRLDIRRFRDISKRVKNGNESLPFVMRSINKNILDSEKLKGQNILVQFQVIVNKPYFNEKTIEEFNNLMLEYKNSKNILGITVFESSKDEIKEKVEINKYPNIEFVADGRNFNERYLNLIVPTYILIDKLGKLVGYYERVEMDKLKRDILGLK